MTQLRDPLQVQSGWNPFLQPVLRRRMHKQMICHFSWGHHSALSFLISESKLEKRSSCTTQYVKPTAGQKDQESEFLSWQDGSAGKDWVQSLGPYDRAKESTTTTLTHTHVHTARTHEHKHTCHVHTCTHTHLCTHKHIGTHNILEHSLISYIHICTLMHYTCIHEHTYTNTLKYMHTHSHECIHTY